MPTSHGNARYARQLSLPGFGPEQQQRLADAHVCCVGAGGLGSPALLYLVAAGVGTITIIDDDTVDVSNLHRQVIHTTSQVGHPKVESARQVLADLNPEVRIRLTMAGSPGRNPNACSPAWMWWLMAPTPPTFAT